MSELTEVAIDVKPGEKIYDLVIGQKATRYIISRPGIIKNKIRINVVVDGAHYVYSGTYVPIDIQAKLDNGDLVTREMIDIADRNQRKEKPQRRNSDYVEGIRC